MPTPTPLPTEIHLPVTGSKRKTTRRMKYLVYFLPGNPAVLAFYRKFLFQLRDFLDEANDGTYDIETFGTSLSGFECDAPSSARHHQPLPVDLDGQIEFAEGTLAGHTKDSVDAGEDVRVVLVGHSLGAFIAMEMLQRYRDSLRFEQRSKGRYRLIATIGLLPGLVHLAQGTVPANLACLDFLPYVPSLLSVGTRTVCWPLPLVILQFMITRATGYSVEDVNTICRWLRSEWGVHESLYLAKEDMRRIADDQWDDEVWGAPTLTPLSQPLPKVFFLFGEHDDWIPSGPRDELIRVRGHPAEESTDTVHNEWRATMEIDRTGIPHDFAVKHSKPIANTTVKWIQQVVKQDRQVR